MQHARPREGQSQPPGAATNLPQQLPTIARYTQPTSRNGQTMRKYLGILARHALVIVTLALVASVLAPAAEASTPSEQYISQNVQKGIAILNNHSLSEAQRRDQFAHFLLNLTHM